MIRHSRNTNAVVLLEVVFALALFFVAAGVIAGGLNMTASASGRLALGAQGADLAVTVLSEIQMGLRQVVNEGPSAFEEGPDGWTWQIVASPAVSTGEGDSLWLVQVIVTHTPTGYAYRLAQLTPGPPEQTAEASP